MILNSGVLEFHAMSRSWLLRFCFKLLARCRRPISGPNTHHMSTDSDDLHVGSAPSAPSTFTQSVQSAHHVPPLLHRSSTGSMVLPPSKLSIDSTASASHRRISSRSGVPLLNMPSLYNSVISASPSAGTSHDSYSWRSPAASNLSDIPTVSISEADEELGEPTYATLASAADTAPERARVAAAFVLDALDGRSVDLKIGINRPDQRCCGFAIDNLARNQAYQYFLLFCIVAQISLLVFEPTKWADGSFSSSTKALLLILDAVFTVVILTDTMLALAWLGVERFIEKRWALFAAICIGLYSIDLLIAFFFIGSGYTRVFRALRPMQLIAWWVELRRITASMLKALPRFGDVSLSLFILIAVYALIGVSLFQGVYHQVNYPDQHFDSFLNAALALVVLLTTENYPDILHPAYDYNSMTAVAFFWSFIAIAVWLFMTVLLAIVFEMYQQQRDDKSLFTKSKEYEALLLAYHILKDDADERLDINLFQQLMQHVRPGITREECVVLFHCMDADGTSTLEIGEFLYLAAVLRCQIERVSVAGRLDVFDDEDRRKEQFSMCACQPRPFLVKVVRSRLFRIVERALLLFAVLFIILYHALNMDDQKYHFTTYTTIQRTLAFLFMFEAAFKFLALGYRAYLRECWFDALSAVIVFVFEILFLHDVSKIASRGIVRAVRVLRLFFTFPRLKQLIVTLYSCIRSILVMLALLASIIYTYTCIGIEIFANQSLTRQRYENFGSMAGAVLSLHQVTVSNNWNDLLYDQITIANHSLIVSSVFFLTFYFFVLLVVLNVLTAMIVDAFGELSENNAKREKHIEQRKMKRSQSMRSLLDIIPESPAAVNSSFNMNSADFPIQSNTAVELPNQNQRVRFIQPALPSNADMSEAEREEANLILQELEDTAYFLVKRASASDEHVLISRIDLNAPPSRGVNGRSMSESAMPLNAAEIERRLTHHLDACAPHQRPHIWKVKGYGSWEVKDKSHDEVNEDEALFAALHARLEQTEHKLRQQ